jgi:hypothetical protein
MAAIRLVYIGGSHAIGSAVAASPSGATLRPGRREERLHLAP